MTDYCYPPVDRIVMESGCYLTAIGMLRHEPGADYPPEGHPDYFKIEWRSGRKLADTILILTSRGRMEWESIGGRGHAGRQEVLHIPAQSWHRYRPDRKLGWTEKWICLRGAHLRDLRTKGLLLEQMQVIKCDRIDDLEYRFDRLREEVLRSPLSNRASWGARALSMLLELREAEQPPVRVGLGAPRQGDNLTDRALAFIETNSHRPIAVDDVARACRRTRRTLERHFRAAGIGSVAGRIAGERIDRARRLLLHSELSIKEIAAECGFNGAQQLIAAFHRKLGGTPSQFRSGAI